MTMTETATGVFAPNQVSVSTYSNNKGKTKLIVRLDADLAERLVRERDEVEVQKFLDTLAAQGGANA